MKNNTFKEFHHSLSWSTRIYTLMVLATLGLSFFYNAWSSNWVMTIIGAVTILLFTETFAIYFKHHPKAWRTIRLIVLLILMALFLISFI